MNIKNVIFGLSILSSVSSLVQETVSFSYTYVITANSYHPMDIAQIYDYKEKLIDVYEDIAFDYHERDHQRILKDRIDEFNIDEYCFAFYKNGNIYLNIGKAEGLQVKGELRRNSCDESVIREKFYIFELFS